MTMRVFAVKDAKTGEECYRGIGRNAQEVYEAWLREDLRPLEHPLEEDLESDDPEVRAKAFENLMGTDTWIEDAEITMHHVVDL